MEEKINNGRNQLLIFYALFWILSTLIVLLEWENLSLKDDIESQIYTAISVAVCIGVMYLLYKRTQWIKHIVTVILIIAFLQGLLGIPLTFLTSNKIVGVLDVLEKTNLGYGLYLLNISSDFKSFFEQDLLEE